MLGAFTAWTLNYIQKAGRLSITWRLREPGTTTIEVIAKNTGQRQLRNVHITSSREGFRPVRLEMGPGQEYCIESLCGKKESREYYTNTTWKHDMGCPGQRWRINPVDFSEIQTGELPPERVIANVLLEVEKYIKDSPVVRSAGATKSITGPNLGEWVLPQASSQFCSPTPRSETAVYPQVHYTWKQPGPKTSKPLVSRDARTKRETSNSYRPRRPIRGRYAKDTAVLKRD